MNNVSEMIYFVSSDMLNLNSISQSSIRIHMCICCKTNWKHLHICVCLHRSTLLCSALTVSGQ